MRSRWVRAVVYANITLYSVSRTGFELCEPHILNGRYVPGGLGRALSVLGYAGSLLTGVMLDVRGARQSCVICFASMALSQALVALSTSAALFYLAKLLGCFHRGYLISQAFLSQEANEVERAGALSCGYLLYTVTGRLVAPRIGALLRLDWHGGALFAALLSLLSALLSLSLPAKPPEVAMGEEPYTEPPPSVLGRATPGAFMPGSHSFQRAPTNTPLPAPAASIMAFRRVGFEKMRAVACDRLRFWLLAVHFILPVGVHIKDTVQGALVADTFGTYAELVGRHMGNWWTCASAVGALSVKPLCRRFRPLALLQALICARIVCDFGFAVAFSRGLALPPELKYWVVTLADGLKGLNYAMLRIILFVVTTSAVEDHERGTVFSLVHVIDFVPGRLAPEVAWYFYGLGHGAAVWMVCGVFNCFLFLLVRGVVTPRYAKKVG